MACLSEECEPFRGDGLGDDDSRQGESGVNDADVGGDQPDGTEEKEERPIGEADPPEITAHVRSPPVEIESAPEIPPTVTGVVEQAIAEEEQVNLFGRRPVFEDRPQAALRRNVGGIDEAGAGINRTTF